MKRSLTRAFAVLTLALPSVASAQLATFDDNPTASARYNCINDGDGTAIRNGYAGFNWSNFFVAGGNAAAAATGGVGYRNGIVTAPCVALNGFGEMAALSSGTDFIFNGGFFTAAFSNALSVRIRAFNASNAEVFTTLLNLNTSGPQLLNVVWGGVRRVTFDSGDNEPGSQFVFDNFRFNNTADPNVPGIVPEPSTYALMATGLIGLITVARRRNTTA